jgi:hypothetical protein
VFRITLQGKTSFRNPLAVFGESLTKGLGTSLDDAVDTLLTGAEVKTWRESDRVSLTTYKEWLTRTELDAEGQVVVDEPRPTRESSRLLREAMARAQETGGTFEYVVGRTTIERSRSAPAASPDPQRIQNALAELRAKGWEIDDDGLGVSKTVTAPRTGGLACLSIIALFLFPIAFLALLIPKVFRLYVRDWKHFFRPMTATLTYSFRDGELRVDHRRPYKEPHVVSVPIDAIDAVICLPMTADPGVAGPVVVTAEHFTRLRYYPFVDAMQGDMDQYATPRLRDLVLAWRGLPGSYGDPPWGDPFLPPG